MSFGSETGTISLRKASEKNIDDRKLGHSNQDRKLDAVKSMVIRCLWTLNIKAENTPSWLKSCSTWLKPTSKTMTSKHMKADDITEVLGTLCPRANTTSIDYIETNSTHWSSNHRQCAWCPHRLKGQKTSPQVGVPSTGPQRSRAMELLRTPGLAARPRQEERDVGADSQRQKSLVKGQEAET